MVRAKKKKTGSDVSESGVGPKIAIGVVVVIAVAAIVVLAMDSGPSEEAPASANAVLESTPPSALPPPPRSFPEQEIRNAPRINVDEARDLLERKAAVVIDVRSAQDYMSGHIPGSLQIPLAFVEGEIPWFPTDKKLITYCT